MRRVLPWLRVLLIALGQLHGLAWLSHHEADPAHCVAQFTEAGCHSAAHDHDDQHAHAAAPSHGCHCDQGQHGDQTDPEHTADCHICHLIAASHGTVTLITAAPSPVLPPVQRRVITDERAPIHLAAAAHRVRGPPHI